MKRQTLALSILASGTLVVCLVGLTGCQPPVASSNASTAGIDSMPPGPISFPDLGPSRQIQPGIKYQEATLERGGTPMRVWFYEPENATGKLPLVLVPVAGGTLFGGIELTEGDRVEHYPYAKAGFAVASFDVDGHVPNLQGASHAELLTGARKFRDARAGLANAETALDFVLAKVPNIDPDRIYAAGHSSAATLSLLTAAQDPRIKACVAYAPATDVEAHLAKISPQLNRALPGFKDFLRDSSPKTHLPNLRCPVFIFYAQDDQQVSASDCEQFAAQLKKSNPQVTVVTKPSGAHYDSMIREGIPGAIEWLQQLAR